MTRRLLREGYATLADLPHDKYLRSVLWIRITEWVLERDQHRCQVCQRKAPFKSNPLEVHHRSYDLATLEGYRPQQLISLCSGCHGRVEFYPDSRKRTSLSDKDVELARLTQLHARIREHGMPVRINTPKALLKEFRYVGDPAYLEFYTVTMLANHLLLALYLKHHNMFRLPFRFSVETIRNPSGASLFSKEKNTRWLTFSLCDESVILRISRVCPIDIDAWLPDALQTQEHQPMYWYMA